MYKYKYNMSYPPKYLCKKNTIEKVSILYETIAESFKYFNQNVDKLKNKLDQLDLSEQIFIDNFLNTYDIYLSDLVNSIGNLLLTKKDIIGDDGSLIIKPVNGETKDYYSEIWYSHTVKCEGLEKIFPSRIVCKYDNFSMNPIKEGLILMGYEFLIGQTITIIKTSSEINNIFNNNETSDDKIKELIKYLNTIVISVSLLEEYCLSNVEIVKNYLENFERIYH